MIVTRSAFLLRGMARFSTLVVALSLAGCSASPEPVWFPLNTGSSWEYAVTTDTDGVVKRDTQTVRVIGSGQFKGKPTFTRRSELKSNVGVEYLLQVSGDAITRIAQRTDLQDIPVADETPRTVMKLPLQLGGTWMATTVAYAVLRKTEFPRELKFGKILQMISQIESFDPSQTQTLLKSLTGGLGVALLTTAVGLVSNIILGFQLVRLDRCADGILADALYFVETDLQPGAR